MATYKFDYNPIEDTFDLVVDETSFHVKDPVDTYNDLPVSGNAENDMRFTKDTDDAWVWTIASESGDISNWKTIPLLANLSLSIIAGDLDDISDGTNYGKVKNTELQDGLVKYVDDGTTGDANRSSAEDIADAISKEHVHSNKSELDLVTDGDHDVRIDNPHIVKIEQLDLATGTVASDVDDAVSKKHTQNTDTDLDSTFEATFVKKVDNVNVLADITSPGANIEDAVTKRHTQNSDTKLDDGQANEVTSANLRTHLDSVSNPHVVTVDQLDLATGTVASDVDDAVTKKHEHSNKALLDTYTQTEVDIADAISKEHTHSNKVQLDLVTDGDHDVRTDDPHDIQASQVTNDSGVTGANVSNALDNLELLITAEDIWDRVTGNVIQPKNANDNVELGTGYLDAGFYKIAGIKILHTPGTNNTFLGEGTGNALTTGSYNTMIGYEAGLVLTSGAYNVILGQEAGKSSTVGQMNVLIGYQAGHNMITKNYNVIIGTRAGYNQNSVGTFIGYYAGYNNTDGYQNTYIGYEAGMTNTTGVENTFVGHASGRNNVSGQNNTYIGNQAGYEQTETNNTFVGARAGYGTSGQSSGSSNTGIGMMAGYALTTGHTNVFIGHDSARRLTTGARNIFIGYRSGYYVTTGDYNILIGREAGYSLTTEDANVFIGYQAGYNETASNRLYIANSNTVNPLIYGEFDNNYVKINGDVDITGELGIKVYEQASEPDLGDEKLAIWINTSDNNRVYLLFSRGTGSQVAVELA